MIQRIRGDQDSLPKGWLLVVVEECLQVSPGLRAVKHNPVGQKGAGTYWLIFTLESP
jgi:hypothetical protein